MGVGRGCGYAAAALALASAAVSAYWLLGGDAGLATVGGRIEEQARTRSAVTLAGLAVVVLAKLVAAALAWVLARGRGSRLLARVTLVGGVLLALYGGVLVAVGAVVLAGLVPAPGADRYALAWHVGLWDLWFLLWGLALAVAARERLVATRTLDRAPA